MAEVKIIFDGAVLENMLRGPDGMVAKFMITRAEIVKQASIIQCNKRTGKLSQSILKRPVSLVGDELSIIVGAYQPYAVYVHNGTGIYGPHATPIVPKTANYLRWMGSDGKVFFAKSVKGYKGNPFLSDNLKYFFA